MIMIPLKDLKTKIYVDGVRDAAHAKELLACYPVVQGFTTNPTLMRKAGVTDYERWARELIAATDLPISFEVVANEFTEMERQARVLASWGEHVYVKIPLMTTHGFITYPLIEHLSHDGIRVNVTAVMTVAQVLEIIPWLRGGAPSCISVFAGRVADTGRDPMPTMRFALSAMHPVWTAELIWASPREVFNVWQANEIGCHIITVPPDLLLKLSLVGKNLTDHSRDTVRMFYEDAVKAGYTL